MILVATQNPAKERQFRWLFERLNIDHCFLSSISSNYQGPEENGANVVENALIKARSCYRAFGLPVIADDAGFIIPALNNEPGVQARRWGGVFKDSVDDETWLAYLLERTKPLTTEQRKGKITAAWAFIGSAGDEHTKEIRFDFLISNNPIRPYIKGHPLSAVAIRADYGKSYLELTDEERYLPLLHELENWAPINKLAKN